MQIIGDKKETEFIAPNLENNNDQEFLDKQYCPHCYSKKKDFKQSTLEAVLNITGGFTCVCWVAILIFVISFKTLDMTFIVKIFLLAVLGGFSLGIFYTTAKEIS